MNDTLSIILDLEPSINYLGVRKMTPRVSQATSMVAQILLLDLLVLNYLWSEQSYRQWHIVLHVFLMTVTTNGRAGCSLKKELRLVKLRTTPSSSLPYIHTHTQLKKHWREESASSFMHFSVSLFSISCGLKNKSFSSGLFHCATELRKQPSDSIGKWFSAEMTATTPQNLPAPFSYFLTLKMHPESSRGENGQQHF